MGELLIERFHISNISFTLACFLKEHSNRYNQIIHVFTFPITAVGALIILQHLSPLLPPLLILLTAIFCIRCNLKVGLFYSTVCILVAILTRPCSLSLGLYCFIFIGGVQFFVGHKVFEVSIFKNMLLMKWVFINICSYIY